MKAFFTCLLCIPTIWIFAQSSSPEKTEILKVKHTKDFTITGKGDAQEWNHTGWVVITQRRAETLRQQGWKIPAPRDHGDPPSYATSFKILYSDKGIYCLYRCEDSAITATLKGDFLHLYDEDVVEAFFRPDTTMPLYFEYELSPLDYELPLLVLNNNRNSTAWTPWPYEGKRKTAHEVHVPKKSDQGKKFTWTAEFFIPYALLYPISNVPPQKGTQWRTNFYRIDYDRGPVYASWQLTRKDFHDYERFGTIEFE